MTYHVGELRIVINKRHSLADVGLPKDADHEGGKQDESQTVRQTDL
ncbi:hypothetical protein JOD17_003766 [Geomicrobium sediminis]|uniref:Uncharacterized protein n=1 Tax=Geomicrobium sediminis TaxID=1347788 RepID=A0ABS2PGT2_9BACL|nr:hypothetical protein [Geomicrobium sediminis]